MEELIFCAHKIRVMGNSKNLHIFNFVILLKSRKFDAGEIYMFYSSKSCSKMSQCEETKTLSLEMIDKIELLVDI